MTPLTRATGIAVALATLVGIAWASSLPTAPNGSAGGVLRLAWTARPERVENCRTQSEEELSKIPAHMRQAVVCEGTTAAYRLEVSHDGSVVLDQIVRAGGWRHDRPLFVSHDIPLPPGDALINVRFVRIDAPGSAATVKPSATDGDQAEKAGERHSTTMDPDRRRREDEERRHLQGEVAPALLSFERRLRFVPRQVILVTYDSERRELVALESLH